MNIIAKTGGKYNEEKVTCLSHKRLAKIGNWHKKEQAQNITNYRYQVSIIGSWGENHLTPLTMLYQNGQPVSVRDKDGNVREFFWDTIGGMDVMLQETEDALSTRRCESIEIGYDPIYGFSTYVDIYYNE